jgi:hypothetical protein
MSHATLIYESNNSPYAQDGRKTKMEDFEK